MIDLEKSNSAHSPAAGVWLARGEGLARAAVAVVRGIRRRLRRALSGLERAQARSGALRALYRLDDRLLADIGLRRDQVAEIVEGMIRQGPVDGVTRAIQTVATESTAAVDASNDRHYRSAA